MKKRYLSLLSLLLVGIMLLGSLAACKNPEETTGSTTETEIGSDSNSETKIENQTKETDTETKATTGKETEVSTESETETETKTHSEDTLTESASSETSDSSETVTVTETEPATVTEEDTTPKLSIDNGELIEYAEKLSNAVSVYNPDPSKTDIVMNNANMTLEYELAGSQPQLVTALKNSKGNEYIRNTMDVFVRTTSGNTYYSSNTLTDTATNIYRLGYYYYDVRLENQDFAPSPTVISEKEIPLKVKGYKHLSKPRLKNGEMYTYVDGGTDPYFVFDVNPYSADQYTYLQLSLKVESANAETIDVYYISDETSYHDFNKVTFSLIPDGEYHTYTVCLSTSRGYTGTISSLRIDFSGEQGTSYTFNSAKLLEADTSDVPDLKLGRFFQVYSDKLHHYAQFCATSKVTNIDAVGVLTELEADRVVSLVIKDKNGFHSSIAEVDFDSAEYVGFDIKDTGIFGYIIPTGEYGGKLEVTLKDGVYSIIQTLTPPQNTISPSTTGTNNANDFYIGQRIYTDNSHDFSKFINEAETERHPLTVDNVRINGRESAGASFLGYDPLRGSYRFKVNGTGFGTAYYQSPNKHYNVTFTLTGDEYDRKMYVSTYTTSGGLECAVLLDDDMLLLPVPVEVCKNFVGDGECNIYNMDEPSYGETYVPMLLKAEEEIGYTIVNLYQNWGKYPLKQLSSIQYFYPYYHLSTGVTESNCIVPYAFVGPYLPDHRAMSAPLWADQPQHTLGGHHRFLGYTDADGNYSASQHINDKIVSHGPTFAEVEMNYISDDGKIKATYTHMEMPQTDENRTYYIMEYEVLEDISFKDFKNDFQFYSVRQTGTGSTYKKVGYLNEKNESVIVDAMAVGDEAAYVLGDYYPYFDFFYVPDYTNENGYVNLSFIVADSSFTIGGEKSDARFIVTNKNETLYLSLNLEEVTLKKGDKFTIRAILTPWGSQESIYDGSNGKAPDQNVLDVRENSVIDPFKLTAVSDCEIIDNGFLPSLRTTHGKRATFTVSGGENNVTVRAYGFNTLTAPVIQEQIDGKWVDYVVDSSQTPDALGNSHYYDGYTVQYDGDGTFSYSFVLTMTGDEERTFRIVSSKAFFGWPEIVVPEEETPIDVYSGAANLDIKLEGAKGVGRTEIIEENGKSFVRIYGNNTDGEGHFTPFVAGDKKETGSYVVVKYRIPTSNSEAAGCFEIFTSTVNSSATAGDQVYCYNLKKDGFWHVILIDISKENHPTFKADEEKYYANYLRLDFFSMKMSEESCIDIEYVGMSSDLQSIFELNSDMNTVTLVTQGTVETYYDVKTGNQVEESGDGKLPKVEYVSPDSDYTESTVKFASCIDMINGWGKGENKRLTNIGATSIKAPDVLDYGVTTVNGHQLIFTGWAVVDGGADRYVWSVDGGVTWHDAIAVKPLTAATADHMTSAKAKLGGYEFVDYEASSANCSFQGTVGGGASVNGLYADLSDYAGETVEITFAVVPKTAPDTLCIIVHVKNVQVAEAE